MPLACSKKIETVIVSDMQLFQINLTLFLILKSNYAGFIACFAFYL